MLDENVDVRIENRVRYEDDETEMKFKLQAEITKIRAKQERERRGDTKHVFKIMKEQKEEREKSKK